MEIIGWWKLKFCLTVVLRNTYDNFTWKLCVVYGSPYNEGKQEFINELHSLFDNWSGPFLIGGDYNLVRDLSKKNNGVIDYHRADKFNDWINYWGLVELKNPTRSFTWVNNQDQPIMAT